MGLTMTAALADADDDLKEEIVICCTGSVIAKTPALASRQYFPLGAHHPRRVDALLAHRRGAMISIEDVFAMDEKHWDDFLMRASKEEMRPIILAIQRMIHDNGESHIAKRIIRRYYEAKSVYTVI